MAEVVLKGETRSALGKGAVRRLRQTDRIPAVIYGGKDGGSVPISVDGSDLRRLMASGGLGRLVKIDLGEAGSRMGLPKELQVDPVRGDFLHIDFHEVALDEAIQTQVGLHMVGEERRENDGGVPTLILRELTVSCLPTAIPEFIEVDVSGLAVGDTVHVGDLSLPEGVEAVDEPDTPVLTVSVPVTETADAEEAEAEEDAAGEEAAEQDKADGE